ncbi:hypothetical protein HB780_13640 (plasmid) [Rhizobium lusitanum]|uniref:hypothetical protein n=1 Tax=Rhizobium lusitanum TaxID=293958 RepID=UPI0016070456|nr:hypothetical protein [Rhizobium lusitanum]QND46644.1 hypothetical protein HB780_13640 [Rhizobium lusitanum]
MGLSPPSKISAKRKFGSNDGGVQQTINIAVVSFLGSGDWLQAFKAGIKQQTTMISRRC